MEGFAGVFEDLEDPRTGNAARHDLLEILLIALCTVLCGGQTAIDMAEFAEAKKEFLREFLTLANGLPSHNTFSRVFRLLDPEQFSLCFGRFMARFGAAHGVIAIDGKVSRRSFGRASGKSARPMVRSYGVISGWFWRKWRPTPSRTRSPLFPACSRCCRSRARLSPLMRSIASAQLRSYRAQIIDQGGNYALALKGNQGSLHADVEEFLADPATPTQLPEPLVEANHGAHRNPYRDHQ